MRWSLATKFFVWIVGGAIALIVFVAAISLSICAAPTNIQKSNQRANESNNRSDSLRHLIDESIWRTIFPPSDESNSNKSNNATANEKTQTQYPLVCEAKGADLGLVYFTYCLVIVGWFGIRSNLETAHILERAYISGGGARIIERRHRGTHTDNSQIGRIITADLGYDDIPTGYFGVQINNYGKTAGELLWVGIGFCDADNVPDGAPAYDFVYRHDWIQPGDRGRDVFPRRIPTDRPATAVFGRFYYRDIFGGKHSCGFINRIEGPTQSDPLLAPDVYTEERDETEESWPRPAEPPRTPTALT